MDNIFKIVDIWAIIDVLVVSYLIYQALLIVRRTRAAQMLFGLVILTIAAILSTMVPLTAMNWMMSKFYSSLIIIMVILFQEDIRQVLRNVGRKPFINANEKIESIQVLEEIARAAFNLKKNRVGALIIVEKNIILNQYINIGIEVGGVVSAELLAAIFQPKSPIHDGAVIVRKNKIEAAGCFLPLTKEEGLNPNLGTRHRAGIGISQETDAVVVIVSEESGRVSIVIDGVMTYMSSADQLISRLSHNLQSYGTKTALQPKTA